VHDSLALLTAIGLLQYLPQTLHAHEAAHRGRRLLMCRVQAPAIDSASLTQRHPILVLTAKPLPPLLPSLGPAKAGGRHLWCWVPWRQRAYSCMRAAAAAPPTPHGMMPSSAAGAPSLTTLCAPGAAQVSSP
jgi:hypothetical protein